MSSFFSLDLYDCVCAELQIMNIINLRIIFSIYVSNVINNWVSGFNK